MASAGFNFSLAMRRVCDDMTQRVPRLAHIDVSTVAITLTQTRKNVEHGMQAAVTPLRFAGGAVTAIRRGKQYRAESIRDPLGNEYLYILTFYLPRFLNHDLEEKLTTICHELWHISPSCDGDLRRHEGRYFAHGPSQLAYDAHAAELARTWLKYDPPYHLYAFLECKYVDLCRQFGRVYGASIRSPRLIESQTN